MVTHRSNKFRDQNNAREAETDIIIDATNFIASFRMFNVNAYLQ